MYRGVKAFAWLTIKPYFRLSLEGAEHLPSGPCIVAPNHNSYLDPVVVQAALPLRLVFLMTRDWYDKPLLRPFFRFMRAVPVDDDARNRSALEAGLAALRRGESLGIFPEGEVRPEGDLGEFHHGVASLAVRARVPVVPAGIIGNYRALPKGKLFPRPARVTVRLGAPLPSDMNPRTTGMSRREILKTLTWRLRESVAELLSDS